MSTNCNSPCQTANWVTLDTHSKNSGGRFVLDSSQISEVRWVFCLGCCVSEILGRNTVSDRWEVQLAHKLWGYPASMSISNPDISPRGDTSEPDVFTKPWFTIKYGSQNRPKVLRTGQRVSEPDEGSQNRTRISEPYKGSQKWTKGLRTGRKVSESDEGSQNRPKGLKTGQKTAEADSLIAKPWFTFFKLSPKRTWNLDLHLKRGLRTGQKQFKRPN